jgi:DNA modification methylase
MFEILVWCKTNSTPFCNNVWLPDLEYCLLFKEKGCKLNDGYELKSKWYLSQTNKADKDLYDHPTIKPLELVKRHILHSTQPNDIVLDCFMGSGTTAVACKETGRRYLGFEIDKTYYEIACNRLKGYSQRDIEHKQKGQQDLFDFI